MVRVEVLSEIPFAHDYEHHECAKVAVGVYELVDARGSHNRSGPHALWVIRGTMIGLTPLWWRRLEEEGTVSLQEG